MNITWTKISKRGWRYQCWEGFHEDGTRLVIYSFPNFGGPRVIELAGCPVRFTTLAEAKAAAEETQ